ncbi:MAG TPA: succinylglutamate desuccinylase/aspartoacylase family protein [Verrucomicrobiae bacterium]
MDLNSLTALGDVSGRRSLQGVLEMLAKTTGIEADFLPFDCGGEGHSLGRFTAAGSRGAEAIRLGVFAAIHGDEPAGALGVVQLMLELARRPEWASGYHVTAYPICNPTGFEDNTRVSRRGKDLNREFWRDSAEPEVRILEKELRTRHFHGLIQLHADDTSDGIYGYVRGHTLTENLLRPALQEAGKILPRNVGASIDGFAARDGIISQHFEGVLGAPKEMDPVPFEIIFETPQKAPMELQVEAFVAALRTIMTEYLLLMSFAQNI